MHSTEWPSGCPQNPSGPITPLSQHYWLHSPCCKPHFCGCSATTNLCCLFPSLFLWTPPPRTMENSVEVSQKIKNIIVFWPSNSFCGIILKENQNTESKDCMKPYVHCITIYSSQDWKQPKCPLVGEWMTKLWHIRTMEYYVTIKMKESYLLRQHGWT